MVKSIYVLPCQSPDGTRDVLNDDVIDTYKEKNFEFSKCYVEPTSRRISFQLKNEVRLCDIFNVSLAFPVKINDLRSFTFTI